MSTAIPAGERAPLPGATRSGQLRRAAVALLVAVTIVGACKPFGPVPYIFIPLITGGGLVLAALVGGKGSRLMGPGLPVMFWGIGIIIQRSFEFTGGFALPTFMIGLGAIASYLLSGAGWYSNAFPVGVAICFIGVGLFVHGVFGQWGTFAFAMLMGLVALAELLNVRSARRSPDDPGRENTAR